MCVVVNINEEYDVYIGRHSNSIIGKWGNPYSHKEGTLAKFKVDSIKNAIEKYEEYLLNNKELLNSLHELKNKRIACWCKTKQCHGYVLKKYVDKLEILDTSVF